MKVIFVTANLPHGADEAFIVSEVVQMIRSGHQVLVVPRSPTGFVMHGESLLGHTRCEALCSAKVLIGAAKIAGASPVRTMGAMSTILKSRTPAIAAKNFAVLPKALWLAGIAREWGAEHIHSHWAGTTATLAMFASALSGIPWSFTAHRWDIVENNLLREKVEAARVARFISEDGMRMARHLGIGPAPNARVLVMGVTLPAEAGAQRHGPWPIVVCPARLVEVKGHRFLMEAWRILRGRGVHGELWLAGDGELRPRLESFIQSYGLQNSIKILGTLPHERLLRIYKEVPISAVALASTDLGNGLHEGIPVALMEAMGYGIPVVATATGGTPELVKPGTGLLVSPGHPPALADAIQSLLQDEDLRRQLGDGARQHVLKTHDIVNITTELAAALAGENTGLLQNISAAA